MKKQINRRALLFNRKDIPSQFPNRTLKLKHIAMKIKLKLKYKTTNKNKSLQTSQYKKGKENGLFINII